MHACFVRVLHALRVTLTSALCWAIIFLVAVSPHPLYVEIGTRIKARRRALDLKQETLAQQLGISRGSLANIETGRQKILVDQLYRYAAVLHLRPTDLLPPPEMGVDGSEREDLPLSDSLNLSSQQRKQVEQLFHQQVTIVSKPAQEISHAPVTKR
jgi:transcriptional regulator with XRE-family HTH domain